MQALVPGFVILQVFFAGFIIAREDIPPYCRWLAGPATADGACSYLAALLHAAQVCL